MHLVTSLRHGLCCHGAERGICQCMPSHAPCGLHTAAPGHLGILKGIRLSQPTAAEFFPPFLSLSPLSLLQDAAVVVFLCLQPTRGQLLSTASPPGPTSDSIWSTATQAELNGLPRRCCQYAVKHRPVQQPNELKSHSQKNDFAKIHQAAFAPRPELPCCNRADRCVSTAHLLHCTTASPVVQSWTAADSALGTSTVINHTLTLDIHAAQEARKCKPPQPPRDPQEEGTTLETASNLSKLSPYLSLAAACHLTLMIHLPSVHCDGVVR
ncbi:hypothetical protein F2P79_024931 [Pimephales promelas]|nr:hypothetical protein F2P79_024931 [Pimephales promelas]